MTAVLFLCFLSIIPKLSVHTTNKLILFQLFIFFILEHLKMDISTTIPPPPSHTFLYRLPRVCEKAKNKGV